MTTTKRLRFFIPPLVASIELPAKLRKLNDNAHLVSITELPANLRNLNDDVAAVFGKGPCLIKHLVRIWRGAGDCPWGSPW